MKRFVIALLVALLPMQGWSQTSVLQGGSWTAGRVPMYSASGGASQPTVQQSAPASGGAQSISELSLIARGTGTAPFVGQGTGYLGSIGCLYDGPTTGAYHQLCLSPNATGSIGLLSYNAFGGASAQDLYFNINGTSYQFPFTSGGAVGPPTSIVGDLACFNNTTGTLLADCGPPNVATIAALTALTTRPTSVVVDGFYAAGDGGGGTFYWVAGSSATAVAGMVISPTSGTAGRYFRIYEGAVSVLWTGAKCDTTTSSNGTDNLAAFTAAVGIGAAVYVPGCSSQYKVSSQVALNNGQLMYGDGRTKSVIAVQSTFDLGQLGVIKMGTGEPGASVNGIGVYFYQPDTATRGSLINYPPAFWANNASRLRIDDVRCTAAMVCLDMRGNAGGAMIGMIESSAFNYSLRVDGSLDTVWFNTANIYPFGLTANQITIFEDATTVGIDFGRVDAFFINSVICVAVRKCSNFHIESGGSNIPNGTIGSINSDGGGAIVISAGNVTVGTLVSSIVVAADYAVAQTGGNLTLGGVQIRAGVAATNPHISTNGSGSNAFIQIGGLYGLLLTNDNTVIYTSGGSTTNFAINNFFVLRTLDVVYTKPTIWINTGRGTINGASTTDKGTGAGVFLLISTNDLIQLANINPVGWTVTVPAAMVQQTFFSPISYGGVTLANSVTGTGSMVLSASPTLTGTPAIGAATGTSLVTTGAVTAGTALAAGTSVTAVTHLLNSSAVPAASSCGTSPAITASSTNQGGQFTTGTGTPSACTITFANAFPTAAFCTVTPVNAAAVGVTARISASSASAFTATLGSGTDTATYNYHCMGK